MLPQPTQSDLLQGKEYTPEVSTKAPPIPKDAVNIAKEQEYLDDQIDIFKRSSDQWDLDPGDMPYEEVLKQVRVPVHGTDFDQLDDLLTYGTTPKNLIDLTDDKKNAVKYPVTVVVPLAKSHNPAKIARVIINSNALQGEQRDTMYSYLSKLKGEYNDTRFDVVKTQKVSDGSRN